MAPILYQDILSPPVQAVILTVRKAGLESVVQTKDVALAKGEHMAPDYVKKFPMHAVPALEDDGLFLENSHAICTYLVSAYAKDDSLYPKDAKKRAQVDQYLHFSNGILYAKLRDMSEPIWMKQTKTVSDERKARTAAALESLQTMLGDKKWLCGDQLTVADICCVAEVNGCQALFGDITQFKSLYAWFERCRAALPGFDEIATAGLEKYKAVLAVLMA